MSSDIKAYQNPSVTFKEGYNLGYEHAWNEMKRILDKLKGSDKKDEEDDNYYYMGANGDIGLLPKKEGEKILGMAKAAKKKIKDTHKKDYQKRMAQVRELHKLIPSSSDKKDLNKCEKCGEYYPIDWKPRTHEIYCKGSDKKEVLNE